ncbi:TetR-like C-terminal domain-containing protein [Levilactobacillus enshiensis]|uniref:TetR-like C-terminal domain-containing protein n=1 Tax=Levilactobacillus enshiensis TaxID=2590213 RepID=UPI00117B1B68|nr:TetR-like C-terminal domain-containing protein [Levilactobacillus enshiensis]
MDIRQQLFNAVYTLGQHQEIKSITVNDILQTASVSRGSFYKYFADKYDVINNYYQEAMIEIFKDCHEYTWEGIFTKSLTYLKAHQAFYKMTFQDAGQNSFTEFFHGELLREFSNAIAIHSTHPALTSDEQKALAFYVDGFVTYTRHWALTGMQQPAAELGHDLHSFMPELLCRIKLNIRHAPLVSESHSRAAMQQ